MRLKQLLAGLAFVVLSAGLFCGIGRAAQMGAREEPDMAITPALRTEVIEGALREIRQRYVFPEVAEKMETAIRERLKKGEYDTLTSAKMLAQLLTDHLREVCRDRHLGVRYFVEAIPKRTGGGPSTEERERYRRMAGLRNFGFTKVERLPGNIGYLGLEGFEEAALAAETAAAAMNFLANTEALIIDLRRNGGGDPDMVALLCSYFFDDATHLNDIYDRPSNTTRQFWTLSHVPGKRYLGKEVYVLTSKSTFSAAEEFSYNLQSLKRATIVGETTGGGAHPTGSHRLNDHFMVRVPMARSINPVTKTNWEGTGVKPHVETPAEQAMKNAQLAALKHLATRQSDPRLVEQLQTLIGNTQKELDELKD